MENENKQTAESGDKERESAADMSELSAESIEERITSELAKVVGIDKEILEKYVEFLGTMKAEVVKSMLKTLKDHLGEQLLPLLEIMAHDEQKPLAEMGIHTLGTIQSFKAAQILSDINDTDPDKKLRKAARKSLYKLRSAGIEVETSLKPLLGESKHERYKTLISAVDGTGTQLIILSEEMLAGDLHLLQVIANDEKGMTECFSRRGITKKMFARFPETFARETGRMNPMLVEADYNYAMSLVVDAENISNAEDQELPENYVAIKDFFGLNQAQPVDNPVYQMLDAENLKDQPYFLRTSEELFQNDTFLGWLLPINAMGEYAQEILDQEDSVLELSPQFQQERKEEVYQKVIDAHLGEDVIKRLQRRLEIMAYIFLQQEHEEDAKRALTAALAFKGMSNSVLKTHPFLRRLIVDSIEAARYVIEDGYDPDVLDKERYIIVRDEEGKIVVQLVEE
jgi:hypothetical protein